jgi:hypothetical protein
MRLGLRVFLPLISVLVFALEPAARAQDQAASGDKFPGVKQVLTPEQYAAAGLSKLSPDEVAKLDESLRGYFNGATEKAATQAASKAVDEAVKTHKVQPPVLIESKIVGTVAGWKQDTVFVLENGQHWKTTEIERRYFTPLTNPDVFIVKDMFGYKMAIAGGGVTRVRRIN